MKIYPDPESTSAAAAELFARCAADAVKERGRFTVALSGGSTPARAYILLASPPWNQMIDWKRVHIFWGDERCVPPDDPRRNSLMARRTLLDHVPVPPEQIHPMDFTDSPETSASRYESLLREHFPSDGDGFDLVLLGLGTNGHTASLFPGTDALRENERLVAGTCPAGEELCRITLTAHFLNRAKVVAFLVFGGDKADVLREVLEGPRDPLRLPAQFIQPRLHGGKLLWLLDKAAASRLTGWDLTP